MFIYWGRYACCDHKPHSVHNGVVVLRQVALRTMVAAHQLVPKTYEELDQLVAAPAHHLTPKTDEELGQVMEVQRRPDEGKEEVDR